jgi:ribosomal protein L11 methyltransferase
MSSDGLVRLGIRVRREQAEIALAALLPLLQAGAEETEPGPGEIEYAVYAPRAELPGLDDVRALAGDALLDVTLTEVPPGWERRWHEYLRAVEVAAAGRRLRVRPPWLPAAGDADLLEVVIDPGDLFGAGTHPTTQLCLELLEAEERTSLLDVGCGSGVLSIAAAKLGFEPVVAFDFDPQAVEATERNALDNGVAIDVRLADLRAGDLPETVLAVANIAAEAVVALGPSLGASRVITSGYLVSDDPELDGYRLEKRVQKGGWAADLHVRR